MAPQGGEDAAAPAGGPERAEKAKPVRADPADLVCIPKPPEVVVPKPKVRRHGLPVSRPACVLLVLLTAALIGVGAHFLLMGMDALSTFARATSCLCQIKDFQANQAFIEPGMEPITCADRVGFVIAARCAGSSSGMILVQNFVPEFETSYTSATGVVPVHEAFSCCPYTMADFCAFQDTESGLFCDDFGRLRGEACPMAPWPCYFLDLPDVLAKGVTTEDLQIGDLSSWWVGLVVSAPSLSLGVMIVLYLTKNWWAPVCRRVCKKKSVPKSPAAAKRIEAEAALGMARMLPPMLRTKKMKQALENYSATIIQCAVRSWLSRRSFRRLVARMSVSGDARALILQDRLAETAEGDKDDPEKVLKRLARRFNKGLYPELAIPAGEGPRPHQALYDSGSPDTFKRMVWARVASLPGDEVERIEVALTHAARDLEAALEVTDKTSGSRLMVAADPPGIYNDLYNIRRGQQIIKVGKLEWPKASGGQLRGALRTAPRPLFLVIEGKPLNPDKATGNVRVRRQRSVRRLEKARDVRPDGMGEPRLDLPGAVPAEPLDTPILSPQLSPSRLGSLSPRRLASRSPRRAPSSGRSCGSAGPLNV